MGEMEEYKHLVDKYEKELSERQTATERGSSAKASEKR